mmetsp:Transcript_52961/g.163869  ORF Transcript_52961/g.163869 Transcript_52961/m.163869 type:complete len:314 (+) Transcript_52961:58-999(+)
MATAAPSTPTARTSSPPAHTPAKRRRLRRSATLQRFWQRTRWASLQEADEACAADREDAMPAALTEDDEIALLRDVIADLQYELFQRPGTVEFAELQVQTEAKMYSETELEEELEAAALASAEEVVASATAAGVEQARSLLAAELEQAKQQLASMRVVTFKCDTKDAEAQIAGAFLSKAEHKALMREKFEDLTDKVAQYRDTIEELHERLDEEWWETDTSRDGETISEGAEEEEPDSESDGELDQEADRPLLPGAMVHFRGLTAVPELNGRLGTVMAFNKKKERWAVRLGGPANKSGETKLFRPENLEYFAPP